MTLVSIIITCFNSQETIVRSVNSAIKQDWEEIEIIVVDDFSTDNSYNLLKNLAKNNEKINLLKHSSNLGYPAALNTALRKCKGDFIAIFDADDFNLKNRISSQIKRILEYEKENSDALILCYANRDVYKSGAQRYDHVAYAIGRTKPEPFGIEVAEYLFGLPVDTNKVWGMFGSCTLMARRSLFKKIGSFDESFRRSAEWDFAIRASFQDAHFISVNNSLVKMYKTSSFYKSGFIPLVYSLKLREKYKAYLKKRGYFYASRLIAISNFYFNKKNFLVGYFFKIISLLISPNLFKAFVKKKLSKFFQILR